MLFHFSFNSWSEAISKLIAVLGVADYVKFSYDGVDQRLELKLQYALKGNKTYNINFGDVKTGDALTFDGAGTGSATLAYSALASSTLGLRMNRPCTTKRPLIAGQLPTNATISRFEFSKEQSISLRVTLGRDAEPAMLVIQYNGTAFVNALPPAQIDERVRRATVAASQRFEDVMRASLERVAALRDQLSLNFTSANGSEFQLAATSSANGICRIRLELLAATGFASDQTGTTESSTAAPREVRLFVQSS